MFEAHFNQFSLKSCNVSTLILAQILQMSKLSFKVVKLSRVVSGRERAHDIFL